MASVSISLLLKVAADLLSLTLSTSSNSSATTSTVADDLEKLEAMLERTKAALLDAEKRDILDESVKLWLKEIKDVAYDAEDLLDEYQYEVLRAQVENRAIAAATSEASRKRKHVEGEEQVMPLADRIKKISIPSNMVDRINRVRERLHEISKDRHDLHLKPEDGQRRPEGSSEYPQPTSHMVNEQDVYGREDDKKKLIDWLLSEKQSKFEVLAVVGKGGMGKTTLAQLVYNDQNISEYFETRMWICVSNDFNLIRLTRAMMECVTKQSCTLSELSLLQESLKERLKGKRLFLVLDDVWNEDEGLWKSLSFPLHGAEMVRIIVTARNEPVAKVMQTTDPYGLGYLPKEQCRQLFMRLAFCGLNLEEFPSLAEIGEKIVKKCDGLPLAVKSLGGLLQHEIDEEKWKDVLDSKLWENKTDILPALMLSYIRMPTHLKPCFEICSMFPKDYEFCKDELVNLWAAHGYIQHNGRKDAIKEIGYMYFNELRRRSFFDKLHWGYIMHDNIHDLAHYVHVGMYWSNHSKHKIRHLSMKNESLEFNLDDTGALRTLILQGFGEDTKVINDILKRSITRLTHLRYVDIKLYRSEVDFVLPWGLGNLICLRHLELYSDGNLRLPKSIDYLYNLVMMKITCHGLVELPEMLRNLVSLTTIHFSCFSNDHLPALCHTSRVRSLGGPERCATQVATHMSST